MRTIIFFVGIFNIIVTATSNDCPYTSITFVKKQGWCSNYEGGTVGHSTPIVNDPYKINQFADNLLPFCEANVCGDGRHHLFCTTTGGSSGDCIPGDAVKNFESLYAGRVDNVAEKLNTLAVIPAVIKTLAHEFTTEDRSIRIYEHGDHTGESLKINSKKGQCVNLPREWQMRVSSYGSKKQARFYTGEDCTGHSVVACRDFTKSGIWEDLDNLWGLLCSTDHLNDNTRSYKFE